MIVPDSELIKDALKLIAISLPLAYILVRGRGIVARDKRLFFLMFGFSLLIIGALFDFTGDITPLKAIPLIGGDDPHHEQVEDVLGFIGFLFFAAGIIAEINHASREDVEKKKMIATLQQQTDRLKRFDELKTKFVGDVSHEFRSPIASITLSISNVIDGLMGDVNEEQRETLHLGKLNLDRLSRLVSDLLTLSSMESGHMVMRRSKHNLSSLVDEAYLSLRSLFEGKRIAFKAVCYAQRPEVWCDHDRVVQVFVNLLSNSIKYSASGTRVEVRVSDAGKDLKVEIEDQGKGIAQEDLKKLFTRFERLSVERVEGVGLGLAIAKEIVGMHHGTISVQSRVGEGTCFAVTLPRDVRGGERKGIT